MKIQKLIEEIKSECEVRNVMRARIFEAVDIEDKARAAAGQPRFPLSPSACLKPARDLYYDLCNYYKPGSIPKDEIEPRAKLLFENGYVIEDLLKKYVKKAYDVMGEQQYVTFGQVDGLVLGGSIDWAINVDGEVIICDSKSSGDFPFKQSPKEENIAQMQLYMHSEWARKLDIKRAILIYYNKNDSNIKCIEVPYKPKVAQELLERLIAIYACYKSGRVPAREVVLGYDWKARYSSYKTYDNHEFTVPAQERKYTEAPSTRIIITDDLLKEVDFIKLHVLTYGSDLVEYDNAVVYATLKESDDKIKLTLYKGE